MRLASASARQICISLLLTIVIMFRGQSVTTKVIMILSNWVELDWTGLVYFDLGWVGLGRMNETDT